MKIMTIIGARPQFIKAAAVSRVVEVCRAQGGELKEIIVHTGQHYDDNMSQIFFDELEIPKPDYNLGIGGGSHGQNTGRMLEAIESVLLEERPDWVLVYGDTDSTLAGALAAAKLHIPMAHVEAGLRSFNRRMPEEINRVLTDHAAALLFAPTRTAIENLRKEGFSNIVQDAFPSDPSQLQSIQSFQLPAVINVGDVMYDAALFYAAKAEKQSRIIQSLGLTPKNYVLATVHRAENTDDPDRLKAIVATLAEISNDFPVILPLHPRTRNKLKTLDQEFIAHCSSLITMIDPLGYLDMVMLEKNAAVIATDSGGVQKEAFFHGVPCVTLRKETEWVELLELGWNRLAPPDSAQAMVRIVRDAMSSPSASDAKPYGKGNSAELIVEALTNKNSLS